jgi:hypothetical protein
VEEPDFNPFMTCPVCKREVHEIQINYALSHSTVALLREREMYIPEGYTGCVYCRGNPDR